MEEEMGVGVGGPLEDCHQLSVFFGVACRAVCRRAREVVVELAVPSDEARSFSARRVLSDQRRRYISRKALGLLDLQRTGCRQCAQCTVEVNFPVQWHEHSRNGSSRKACC